MIEPDSQSLKEEHMVIEVKHFVVTKLERRDRNDQAALVVELTAGLERIERIERIELWFPPDDPPPSFLNAIGSAVEVTLRPLK